MTSLTIVRRIAARPSIVQSLRLIQASPPSACTIRSSSLRPRSSPVTDGPAFALGTPDACPCAAPAIVITTVTANNALRKTLIAISIFLRETLHVAWPLSR